MERCGRVAAEQRVRDLDNEVRHVCRLEHVFKPFIQHLSTAAGGEMLSAFGSHKERTAVSKRRLASFLEFQYVERGVRLPPVEFEGNLEK